MVPIPVMMTTIVIKMIVAEIQVMMVTPETMIKIATTEIRVTTISPIFMAMKRYLLLEAPSDHMKTITLLVEGSKVKNSRRLSTTSSKSKTNSVMVH